MIYPYKTVMAYSSCIIIEIGFLIKINTLAERPWIWNVFKRYIVVIHFWSLFKREVCVAAQSSRSELSERERTLTLSAASDLKLQITA